MKHNSEAVYLYMIIENRLKVNPPVTITELKSYCEKEYKNLTKKDLVIMEDVLEEDISNMKTLLHLPIKKSKITGGFYLNPTTPSFLDSEKYNRTDSENLILKYLFGEKPNEKVYFHSGIPFYKKGWQHLSLINKAINDRLIISFGYRLKNSNITGCEIFPYKLQCENYNWVVIGYNRKKDCVEVYSLAKIFPEVKLLGKAPAEEIPIQFTLYTNPIVL